MRRKITFPTSRQCNSDSAIPTHYKYLASCTNTDKRTDTTIALAYAYALTQANTSQQTETVDDDFEENMMMLTHTKYDHMIAQGSTDQAS